MCRHYVAYFRVSTAKQGKSGLGLEAQEAAVAAFVGGKGADAKLLASYTEVESGKRDDRPELAKAMEHARLTGATLLIAKLDRLSRDAHFLLGLQKAGVEFTACDMPHADKFTVGIMAMVAQKEREAISQRTKEALAAAKARGVKLGNPNGASHLRGLGNDAAAAALRQGAQARADGLAGTIAALRERGVTSANGLAKALNEAHIATPRGGRWTARSVLNVMARL
ncbi:recombinase family protein [Kaistia sp. UC242_56]|uniref:recombinase family protein n=1 Tax=Kaistia sp. UC242_56 TaxID=3374625 RepID=UPI0037B26AAF